MAEHDGIPTADTEAAPPSVTFASGGLSWTRVSLPRLLSRIAKGLYAFGALSALGFLVVGPLPFSAASAVSTLAWPLFIVSFILSLTQNASRGTLEVAARALVVIGADMKRKSYPRARIRGALVVEREMFGAFVPTVEIELANGDVLTARLADPSAARAVVRALGFGAGGKRVHASLAKPSRRLLHPLIAFVVYVVSLVGALSLASTSGGYGESSWQFAYLVYPAVALALYAVVKRLVRPPEITVGDDGVLVTGRLRGHFIPRSEIALVSAATGTSLVIEHGGRRTVVGGLMIDDARRSAIARVIDERAGPSAAGADRFVHYERAGRDVAAWREHLARAMNETSYRANAATVDEAVLVLRSAQATPEQRVGAALALRVAGEPKERIRVAVEGAVDERVRDALHAVAEAEDDVVLEKALRRLP